MRLYSIVSCIILIFTVTIFAFAAPARVQEKRQAGVDVMHVPEHVTTELGKRILEEADFNDFNVLWDGWWHHLNVLGEPAPPPYLWRHRNPPPIHPQEMQEIAPLPNVPPPTRNPDVLGEPAPPPYLWRNQNPPPIHSQEMQEIAPPPNVPPPNPPEVHVPPPQNP